MIIILPSNSAELFEQDLTNRTYYLDIKQCRIRGITQDNLECIRQSVYLLLRTERASFAMFSAAYGIELSDLFGQSIYYIVPMLMTRIRSCLLRDERINDVSDFSFSIQKNSCAVSFTVNSRYGDIRLNNEELMG